MNRSKSKKRLAYNTIFGVADKIVMCVLGLVLRRVFLENLGEELQGLSSVFQNVLDFLNLATAGFVAAIFPMLYECNVKDDYEGINSLFRLLKKFYYGVVLIIFSFGFLCSFFIDGIIYKNSYSKEFLFIVFMIQVLTQCIRLLSTPYTTILISREQGFYYVIVDLVINIAVYVTQFFVIIYTQNYLYYLSVMCVGYLIYVLSLRVLVYRVYPWLKNKVDRIAISVEGVIKKMKYTIVMKVASFIFSSTDSVLISSFAGLVAVNAYSNYMTIATAAIGFYSAFEGAVKNYYGNKLSGTSDADAKENFLKNSTFAFFVVGTVIAVGYTCLIADFVDIWIGNKYRQTLEIDILFGVFLFASMMMCGAEEYLLNFGLFKKEMNANISSAIINIAISLVLVRFLGISGVLIGTIVGMIIRFIQRSNSCYLDMQKKVWNFYREVIGYFLAYAVVLCLCLFACWSINVKNVVICMFIKACLVLILTIMSILVLFSKKKELRSFIKIFKYRRL